MSSYGFRDAQGGYGRVRRPPIRPTITAARSPNNRAGALGVGPTPLGLSTRTPPKPAFTQDQVTQSLAANPHAAGTGDSLFTYQGPPQQQQKAAPAAPTAPELSYDYSADPILNQVKALSSKQRTDAQSTALMLRKQTAIDYGDPDVAAQFGDQSTVDAAKNNPFSVRAQLKRGYERGTGQLEEGYNQSNLFYGGARVKGLADFNTDYQGQLSDAGVQERGILQGIGDNLATALSGADLQDINAQGPAADRAIGNAIDYGYDPGAAGPITPEDVNQFVDPTQPTQPPIAAPTQLPVGMTNDPLLYLLLGRKMDPRYDMFG